MNIFRENRVKTPGKLQTFISRSLARRRPGKKATIIRQCRQFRLFCCQPAAGKVCRKPGESLFNLI